MKAQRTTKNAQQTPINKRHDNKQPATKNKKQQHRTTNGTPTNQDNE